MRAIRFLPLVFLTGIDGFAMFAPYVTLVLAAAYIISRVRLHGEPMPNPVTISA